MGWNVQTPKKWFKKRRRNTSFLGKPNPPKNSPKIRFFRTLKKHHKDAGTVQKKCRNNTFSHCFFKTPLASYFLGTWKNVRLSWENPPSKNSRKIRFFCTLPIKGTWKLFGNRIARSKPKILWISWRNLVWPLRLSRSKVNDPMNRSASLGMGGWDSPPGQIRG